MPLKQPNLIIFKNLPLIDSLKGGERQRLTAKADGKDKDNNKSKRQRQRQRQRRNPPSAKGADTPLKKWELTTLITTKTIKERCFSNLLPVKEKTCM
jgi:hypothetical protein